MATCIVVPLKVITNSGLQPQTVSEREEREKEREWEREVSVIYELSSSFQYDSLLEKANTVNRWLQEEYVQVEREVALSLCLETVLLNLEQCPALVPRGKEPSWGIKSLNRSHENDVGIRKLLFEVLEGSVK